MQRSTQSKLYQFSNLEALGHMTFAAFHERGRLGLPDQQAESLRFAFNLAQQFASRLDGWLLLMGNNGCGKTHLAAAIANQVVSLNVPTLFLTVPDLLDWLRFSYQAEDTSFEQRFEEIRNVRLLVLDDFGTQNTTGWAQEKLFQIINHRYVNRLATVLTTNLDLNQVENRIRSRLNDPELVKTVIITAPDYRSPVNEQPDESISTLHMLSDRTFGNFSLREREPLSDDEKQNLEKVFHACQQFAERPAGWLVLLGRYGCGKTHLAAAIGNYRFGLGDKLVFVVVPDLLDHLRATFSPSSSTSYDRLFEQVRSTPLLILDDLGTQSATPWAREKLYQIFNYRYNARLPMIVTSAFALADMDERIRSRMLDRRISTIYSITAPPYHPPDNPRRGRPKKLP